MEQKECPICKAALVRPDQKYCSLSCRSKGNMVRGRGKHRINLVCKECQAPYQVVLSRKGRSKYCGKHCAAVARGKISSRLRYSDVNS